MEGLDENTNYTYTVYVEEIDGNTTAVNERTFITNLCLANGKLFMLIFFHLCPYLFLDKTTIHFSAENENLFNLKNKTMCKIISISVELENGTTLHSDLNFGETDTERKIKSLIKEYKKVVFLLKDKYNVTILTINEGIYKFAFL